MVVVITYIFSFTVMVTPPKSHGTHSKIFIHGHRTHLNFLIFGHSRATAISTFIVIYFSYILKRILRECICSQLLGGSGVLNPGHRPLSLIADSFKNTISTYNSEKMIPELTLGDKKIKKNVKNT
jgi:hypothetical protein